MNDELIQQLTDSVRNLSEVTSTTGQSQVLNTEILKKLAAAQGIQLNNIKGLDAAFGNLKGSVSSQSAAYEANKKASEEYAKAMGNFNAALGSASKSVTSFGMALLSTEKSFAKYNSGLDAVGDAALSLGKNFGLFGIALGGIIKVATVVATQWTQQADSALKATDDLSKMGAAGSFTANKILEMGEGTGLSFKNLELFTKATKTLSTATLSLGTTAGEGVAEFAKMTAVSEKQRMAFQRLGISQGELIQSQADFVSLQKASGVQITARMKQDNGLQKASLEYTKNLLELAAITGEDLEGAKKLQIEAQSELETKIQTNMMQQRINALQKEGTAQAEAQAQALEKELKSRNDMLAVAASTKDADVKSATASFLATGAITEQSVVLKRLIPNIEEFGERVKNGEDVSVDFAKALQEGVDASARNVGTAGMLDKTVAKTFGMTDAMLTWSAQRRGVDLQAAKDAARKDIGKPEDGETGKKTEEDPAQIARNKVTETEIALQVKYNEILRETNPLLQGFNTKTMLATAAAAALAAAATAAAIALGKMALGKGSDILDAAGSKKAGNDAAGSKKAGKLGGLGRLAKGIGGVGAVVGVGLAAKEGYDKFQDIDELQKTGDISNSQATLRKSETVGTGVGSAAGGAGGAWGGAVAGAAVGSVVPVVGTVIGGILGAAVGGWLGSKGGELIGSKVGVEAGKALGGTTGAGPNATPGPNASSTGGINPRAGASPSSGGGVQSSADQLKNAGLVLKRGDVQKEGAELDPNLIEIAKQIQAQVPGFVQFTGFNDQFHSENAPGSLHAKGKAFDFIVNKKPTKEEGEKIKVLMKQLGVDYAIDEYNSPSAHATGGHFHGQLKAYDGGVFEGPGGGYNVEMHNREAIVPLPNPDSVISVEDSKAQKSPLSSVMNETNTTNNSNMMSDTMLKMFGDMVDKLDSVVNHLATGNDHTDQLLKYSRV